MAGALIVGEDPFLNSRRWCMCAAIPAILTREPKGAPLAGDMPKYCPISKRVKGWHRAPTSSSTRRHTIPRDRSSC